MNYHYDDVNHYMYNVNTFDTRQKIQQLRKEWNDKKVDQLQKTERKLYINANYAPVPITPRKLMNGKVVYDYESNPAAVQVDIYNPYLRTNQKTIAITTLRDSIV